jgi:hypothetical protein
MATPVDPAERDLLTELYRAFNARDIDAALARLATDIDWPNGMEGGRVFGHDGVRAYWTRQWGMIDPQVEPRSFHQDECGRVTVEVHQIVRDRAGAIRSDRLVRHLYAIEGGLIRRMDIA